MLFQTSNQNQHRYPVQSRDPMLCLLHPGRLRSLSSDHDPARTYGAVKYLNLSEQPGLRLHLEKAREVLKDETIAVIGYGVQGPGQSLNLRDNGFNVIVGQRKGGKTWEKAVADGWVPGETLFDIEEACEKATIIQYLLSDAAQIEVWPRIKKYLTPGKALYFSHGFGITYKERTNIIPPRTLYAVTYYSDCFVFQYFSCLFQRKFFAGYYVFVNAAKIHYCHFLFTIKMYIK